nr:ribonuclease H-like domain, reverse transcriptase, RNA-dependent DNA polymerase [Tanacetum cinerariifolium]
MQVDDKKDKATTAFLYQALTEDVILQVAGCKTTKELWESLKRRHVGEEKVQQAQLQSLVIGFQTLQMKEDDTMDAFTAKLNGYATKAKELGKTLDESLLVQKLLDSTPDRFIQIVASIEQTNDLDDITLDEILGKLKAFKERIKLRKEGQVESQENLLFAHGKHSGKESTFKEFRQHIEIEMGMKLRMLRTDRGVERRNRTVVSTTRSMMKAMKLPLTFWVEAVKHAIYILNRDWDNNGKETSTQDTFWASFVVEGVNNENPTPVNTENNDNTYQEHKPITDPDSPIIPPAYTYNPNSEEEEEEATISLLMNSENQFDDTPVRGFKDLTKIYHNARIVETETLLFTEEESRNYKEASTDKKWIETIEIELDSINKNNTWTLTTLPTNQKAIGLKWVFKTKRDAKGKIIKYKARLVAKGYVQEQGIDFDEVFAPVTQIETVSLILALAAYHRWQIHHLDVKSVFLHGDLKEEVYVTQPEGFIQQGNSKKVYKLTKALYGLRQAPRAWNVKLDQTLKSLDFKKYDLIITGTPRKEIDLFKSQMEDKFEMSDLGLFAYYLGIKVTQTGGVITIKQTGYINKILKETSMMESNDTKIPMDPGTKMVKAEDGNSVDATYYRSLIGSLGYLLHIRPDLSYSVGLLSRFMQDPKDHHLKAI